MKLVQKFVQFYSLNEKSTKNVKNYPFCAAQTCYNRHKRKHGFWIKGEPSCRNLKKVFSSVLQQQPIR